MFWVELEPAQPTQRWEVYTEGPNPIACLPLTIVLSQTSIDSHVSSALGLSVHASKAAENAMTSPQYKNPGASTIEFSFKVSKNHTSIENSREVK